MSAITCCPLLQPAFGRSCATTPDMHFRIDGWQCWSLDGCVFSRFPLHLDPACGALIHACCVSAHGFPKLERECFGGWSARRSFASRACKGRQRRRCARCQKTRCYHGVAMPARLGVSQRVQAALTERPCGMRMSPAARRRHPLWPVSRDMQLVGQ